MQNFWQALMLKSDSPDVAPTPGMAPMAEADCLGEGELTVLSSAATSTGSVREANEDSVSVVCPESYSDLLRRGVLAIVADGMGGANGGKCASTMAASLIPKIYTEKDGDTPSSALEAALKVANRSIFSKAQSEQDLSGMGTTCVAMALTPQQAWLAWVGDSRIYLIRNKQLFQMTEDHSLVAGMVREGLLTSEQASCHEERHVLTRALGTRPEVDVAVWKESMPVRVGDRFLLCSDGLHDLVSESELLELGVRGSVAEAAASLVDRANELGGPDNISAILLEVGLRTPNAGEITE